MPKYYFDMLTDTGLMIDPDGTNLPDGTAVEKESKAVLLDVMRDQNNSGGSGNVFLTVRDEDDKPVCSGKVQVEVKPV